MTVEGGNTIERQNPSIYIYDTSGPYSDPDVNIDVRKGLPRMREPWILQRGGVVRLKEISSEYGRMRRDDHSLDSLRFDHISLPYIAEEGKQVSQLYYANKAL